MSASNEIRFLASHEWGRIDEEGVLTVGISEHAQDLLGDIVFVELPDLGKELDAEEESAIVESVKAASDVYSPVAGEVIEINDSVSDDPAQVNHSPYSEGWLFKLKVSDESELDVMSASSYSEVIAD